MSDVLDDLVADGYKPISGFEGMTAGSRVRNRSHQWAAAYQDGTATVVAVMEKAPSAWSEVYRARDVEVVVALDGVGDQDMAAWASYSTHLATDQEPTS